jgi:hypothetical protein
MRRHRVPREVSGVFSKPEKEVFSFPKRFGKTAAFTRADFGMSRTFSR